VHLEGSPLKNETGLGAPWQRLALRGEKVQNLLPADVNDNEPCLGGIREGPFGLAPEHSQVILELRWRLRQGLGHCDVALKMRIQRRRNRSRAIEQARILGFTRGAGDISDGAREQKIERQHGGEHHEREALADAPGSRRHECTRATR
jgi:hypothetical protein